MRNRGCSRDQCFTVEEEDVGREQRRWERSRGIGVGGGGGEGMRWEVKREEKLEEEEVTRE